MNRMLLSKLRYAGTSVAVLAVMAGPLALADDSDRDRGEHWVGTWATAPVSQAPGPTVNINNQTLRQIVHITLGGDRVRVRFSNAFGTVPLIVGAAHIARRDSNELIVAGSGRALTFSGAPDIAIPAGAIAFSDPVRSE